MKNTITLLVLVFLARAYAVDAGETQPTPVDAPIEKVTVYPGQAKITRVASLDLEAGEHSILIERLPSEVDEETFSVSAAGSEDALILGLRHRKVHHLESPQEKTAELERQIKQLEQEQRQPLRDHLKAFEKQKSLLEGLADVAGKEMGEQVTQGVLDVSQWEAAYDFVGRKYMQTDDSIRQTTFALNGVNALHHKLVKQQRQLQSDQQLTSTSVTIDLHLGKAGHIDIALDYVVSGASWIPIYDARLNPRSDSVELNYYAEVTQNTGEDWEDVELTLSTALPSRGTGPGNLLGWFLSVPQPRPRRAMDLDNTITVVGKSKIIDKFVTGAQVNISREEITSRPVQTVDALLEQVTGLQTNDQGEIFIRGSRAGEVAYVVDNLPIGAPLGSLEHWSFNTSFRVKRKETIRSDGQAVRTPIAQYQFEAFPRFICRPKNREDAFRVMSLTNQDKAPLMPGMVSIFVGSSYIGRAALAEMILPREEFEIGFGPDNSLKVSREILNLKTTHKPKLTRTDQTVVIKLVNHGLESREVLLEEPIPISQDSRIKVKLGNVSPKTDKPDALGTIRWNLTLLPGEEKIVHVSYRIEHPRGLQVKGL